MPPIPFSPRECLDFVELSPLAVAAHDKQAWLDLFATYSLVEDPVGSRPIVSRPGDSAEHGPLASFYETFIAPNDVRFEAQRDIVCRQYVWRDLDIHINMASGAKVVTPVHLLYELVEEGEEAKIFRLAAHWELRNTMSQQSGGMAALWRMLRHMGVTGVFGFMRALSSVGEDGKRQVRQFANLFNTADWSGLDRLFDSHAPEIQLVASGASCSPRDLGSVGTELSFSKVLAAGEFVSAGFQLRREGRPQEGVALFRFNPSSNRISALDLYWQGA